MPTYSSVDYLLGDYGHTLFPLSTTEFLVGKFSATLKDYIDNRILDRTIQDYHFLPQQRCYAAKRGFHLRRTVKLDPVAEFFIYDVVYRNRLKFRADHSATRRSYGFRFSSGQPESLSVAYGEFKKDVAKAKNTYSYTLKLDVASYFNSIYHHDLVNTLRTIGWPDTEVEGLGMFLREIASGRSVDCLPHGLHPCKTLGSEFLRFIDNHFRLKSNYIIRFLDDIYLFADSKDTLVSDMLTIQELLGERGLSLNAAKTLEDDPVHSDIAQKVGRIKGSLLRIRRELIDISGDEVETDVVVKRKLSKKQTDFLLDLIHSPDVEESDAELVLVLLRDHGKEILPQMLGVLKRFPGLTKSVYNFTRFASDRSGLDELILAFLRDSPLATEYQLFWLIKLAEDFLSSSPCYGNVLMAAFDHTNSTGMTNAKVLEIPEQRFGLPELRESRLRAGRSDWEAWASACGTRLTSAASRNHLLGYFANASWINRMIVDCLKQL